jgi:hypothetical protein
LAEHGVFEEVLGQLGRLGFGYQPLRHVAAEDVDDAIEVVVVTLVGPLSFEMSQLGPRQPGARSLRVRLVRSVA